MNTHPYFIFDLDGTISDPSLGIFRSINYALQAYSYAPIAETAISQYIGPPLDETFRILTKSSSDSVINNLVEKYRERYSELGFSENSLYPGVADALCRLAGQGYRLGVCTAKRIDFAEKILTLFHLREYFSVISGGDIGTSKDQQLETLLRDGMVSARSTMIGDRAVDVQAARSNRLRAVAVLWGHGSEMELTASAPDLLLREPKELRTLTHAIE